MRAKDLNKNKLITLISTATNKKMDYKSILSNFDNLDKKTIDRYLKDLQENGYLQKDATEDATFYSLTKKYSDILNELSNKLESMLTNALENNAHSTYKQLRTYVSNNRFNVLDDFQLSKYSKTIKEPVHILTDDHILIQKINKALNDNRLVRILYHGKECTLFPVCYIISKDGTRKYLYGVRKKKLEAKNLREIQFLGYLEKATVNREDYMRQIRKAWDIDEQSCNLKLLVRKNKKSSSAVLKQMSHYFGNPAEETIDYNIYEGTMIGINDFKTWLRSYMEICIVLQPEWLRKEFITSLCERKERYGGIQ